MSEPAQSLLRLLVRIHSSQHRPEGRWHSEETPLKKLLGLGLSALLLVGLGATTANAAELAYKNTTRIRINLLPQIVITSTAVATVNMSNGGSHLTSVRLDGSQVDAQTSTVPVTDPEVTAGGIVAVKFSNLKQLSGTFANFSNMSAPLTQNQIGSSGTFRICLFFQGCVSAFLPLPLSPQNNGMTGAGIGGQATIGGFGTIRVSIVYNPWTKNTTTVTNIGTDDGGVTTRTRMGFVHGPASASGSSAAQTSGVVQLVQASSTITVGVPTGGAPNAKNGTLTVATLHFIPEPALLLLIGSGTVGLAVLGRRRMR